MSVNNYQNSLFPGRAKARFMTNKEILIFFVVFILLLVVGLTSVGDYGLSSDEYVQRMTGYGAFKYLIGDPGLNDYGDRFYGTAFELPLIFLEFLLNPETFRDVFFTRHYATFLFFYFSCIVFYFLSRRLLKSWPMAFIAVGMLILNPRIFAHAFYNSKDIIFMGQFVIAFFTMTVFMRKSSVFNSLLHATASACLVDVRLIGIIIPAFTLFWTALQFVQKRQATLLFKRIMLFLPVFVLLTIVFWPYLWPAPLNNFIEAFRYMSRHPTVVDVFYLGAHYKSNALPWHYIPVWMVITIPPVYSFCFCLGVIRIITEMTKSRKIFLLNKTESLLLLAWFFGPIIVLIALKATIYDAWRHLFFVYPAFVIIGVKGIKMLWTVASRHGIKKRFFLRSSLVLCLSFNMIFVLAFMVRYHPHGNVYFNIIAGGDYNRVKDKFEMDYWGLSYRQALEKILKVDDREKITVFAPNDSCFLNLCILPEKQRQRIWYVSDIKYADYYLTNYRWDNIVKNLDEEIFSIVVKGAKIISVFRLKQTGAEKNANQAIGTVREKDLILDHDLEVEIDRSLYNPL